MRHFVRTVCVAGLIGSATGAYAQGLGGPDWSGPYLGGQTSGITGSASTGVSTSDGFPTSYFTPPDPEQIANETEGSIQQSRGSVGVFGGFGRQWGNLYLGVEGSVNTLGFDGQRSVSAVYISNSAGRFTNTISARADWQAALRVRIGMAHEQWLGYVMAGAALSRVKFEATFSDDYLGTGAFGSASREETRIGLALGAGGEIDLGDGWAMRAEYLYSDFGTMNSSSVVTNPVFSTRSNTLENSVRFQTHTVSVGLSFRF